MTSSNILTGDVRQSLDHFRRSVDQLFENFYGYPLETGRPSAIGRDPNGRSARFWKLPGVTHITHASHSPGVSQNDLKVSVRNNQLILRASASPRGFDKNNTFTQLSYGKFYTSLSLPAVWTWTNSTPGCTTEYWTFRFRG